jgi:hypothetical protein
MVENYNYIHLHNNKEVLANNALHQRWLGDVDMKKYLLILVLLLLSIVSSCSPAAKNEDGSDIDVTIFKSPTCGCCVGHSAYLTNHGFDVTVVEMEDLSPIKARHNIPRSMQSCHTAEVGGYFVEGHMPLEAIEKLLEEQPDIDGIALPNMPSGSPGMPGMKQGPFKVYALKGGAFSDFMSV